MRASVYIDGFNFYYGCLKGTPYRWVNPDALCRLLLPHETIFRIRYFTARITPRPTDPDQGRRQALYFRALRTIPHLTIHFGRYLESYPRMLVRNPSPGAARTIEVIKTEEKGSDVNLATYLLLDAFRKEFELAVVISNDSDLVTPIEVVRQELGFDVGVLNPHPNVSQALRRVASFYRPIRRGPLQASQFPATLTDSRGAFTKPPAW